MAKTDLPGFDRDFSGREAPAICVFGAEGTGKTRFCATAGTYAAEHGQVPGWVVTDRKTRKTVREVCAELGIDLPYINSEDFISQRQAMDIAKLDREKDADNEKIRKIYSEVYGRLVDSVIALASRPEVEPIVFETGTQVWDWISYAHFGRKQGAGKSRVWGPPKQDWTDLMDALSHKTVLITLWERDAYRGDERAGFTKPDGPPHIGYTVTSAVRLNKRDKPAKGQETYVDRFSLDVFQSQDNVGLEGDVGTLVGDGITYENLMNLLRP